MHACGVYVGVVMYEMRCQSMQYIFIDTIVNGNTSNQTDNFWLMSTIIDRQDFNVTSDKS